VYVLLVVAAAAAAIGVFSDIHLSWVIVMVREDGKGRDTEIGYTNKRDDNGIRGKGGNVIKVQQSLCNK
jgi:hypothetical protein